MKHASETLVATPDLFLKHSDETLATYVQNNLNTQKHAYETLAKNT
jgi:hypothetical protein